MCLCVWCLLELIAKAITPHPSGTQPLVHTGIHTNICSRTCMHTHTLSYTHTNHETSQVFTNPLTHARACARAHKHAQAHTYASCACICSGRHCCTHNALLLRAHHHSPDRVCGVYCQWRSMPCPFIPNAATTRCVYVRSSCVCSCMYVCM